MDLKEKEQALVGLLETGPRDQTQRQAAALLTAYIVDTEKSRPVPEHVRADMWRGLDENKKQHQLQVCKVMLEWAIAAGNEQWEERLTRMHAIAHLGHFTTQEIQVQGPKVIATLTDPRKAVTEEKLDERMRKVWRFLERLAILDLPLGHAIAELVKGHPI